MYSQTLVLAFLICFTSAAFGAATGEVPVQPTPTAPPASPIPENTYVQAGQYASPYYPEYTNTGYENYLVPAGTVTQPESEVSVPPTGMELALNVLTKVGFYVLWAAGIILVGSLFTTAICTYTPFCTIQYHGLKRVTKESVRSMVNPESISAAAAFVEKAVDKYQRLQRATGKY